MEGDTLRTMDFIPGEDFDPHDPDDRDAVALAMDIDLAERMNPAHKPLE